MWVSALSSYLVIVCLYGCRYGWVSVSICPLRRCSKASTTFNQSRVKFWVQWVCVISQNRSKLLCHLSFVHRLYVILLPPNQPASPSGLLICLSSFPLQPWFKLPPQQVITKLIILPITEELKHCKISSLTLKDFNVLSNIYDSVNVYKYSQCFLSMTINHL